MRDYIYILNLTPKFQNQEYWTEKENQVLEKHDQRLSRQKERGTIKYVGKTDLPVENEKNFGLVVFQAESDTMAELFMQSDPAIMGKMMTGVCLPFKQVY